MKQSPLLRSIEAAEAAIGLPDRGRRSSAGVDRPDTDQSAAL
jgi:hypothetical protein